MTIDGRVPYASLNALTDERVMEELRAGNTDAFAVIFDCFHRMVQVTALRILKDANEAEDIPKQCSSRYTRQDRIKEIEGSHRADADEVEQRAFHAHDWVEDRSCCRRYAPQSQL